MEFVYEVENSLSKELCEELIEKFRKDDKKSTSCVGGEKIDPSIRKSKVLNLSIYEDWKDIDVILESKLKEGISKYKKYLDNLIPKNISNNIFNSLIDEGYTIQSMSQNDFYTWHIDQFVTRMGGEYSTREQRRVITCIWYLNTLEENKDGGSTDFWNTYKIQPKQGSLLFFPSTWTYIHRGSPVKSSNTKYTCITWLGY
jgi:hypothetical protein